MHPSTSGINLRNRMAEGSSTSTSRSTGMEESTRLIREPPAGPGKTHTHTHIDLLGYNTSILAILDVMIVEILIVGYRCSNVCCK